MNEDLAPRKRPPRVDGSSSTHECESARIFQFHERIARGGARPLKYALLPFQQSVSAAPIGCSLRTPLIMSCVRKGTPSARLITVILQAVREKEPVASSPTVQAAVDSNRTRLNAPLFAKLAAVVRTSTNDAELRARLR